MPSQPRFQPPLKVATCDHGIVYRNDREFCGWPFYCGLWKLPGGDVVTGFKKIPNAYGTSGEISHTKLTVGQGKLFLIRSPDDGATWDAKSQLEVFNIADDGMELLGVSSTSADGWTNRPPLLHAGAGVARRPHPGFDSLPARRDRRHVDRHLRERRRRAHVSLRVARQ